MKILKHILSIVIWTLLGLYLLFILTFSIPAVQEYLAQRVSHVLAAKLGTSVHIDRLKFDIPSHITLYDVSIKDQQGRNMLTASRLSTRLDLLPLREGKISISTAQIFGAHAKFYQATADSQPNFQFVLDSLASKDTTSRSPLNLRINSLIIRRTSVSFDQLDAEETPGRLNPRHLALTDISTHIILKQLTNDSLNVNMKRLSFREKSGMEVQRLQLHFEAGQNRCRLTDFRLHMPGTDIALGDIDASYRYLAKQFIVPSLRYTGSIEPSTIRLSDLSYLLPTLKTFNSTLSLSAHFKGEGENVDITQLEVGSTTGDININIDGNLRRVLHSKPEWTAFIHDLGLSAKTIGFISENLRGERVQIPDELERLGNVHLRGTVSGVGISTLRANNQLETDAGNVAFSMSLDSLRRFQGHVDTQDFNLKRVLDNEHFGTLSTTIDLKGKLAKGNAGGIEADGIVKQFEYNGYSYQNIVMKGLLSDADTHGQLSIDDSNIRATIEGQRVHHGKQNDIQLNISIADLAPKAINLTDYWGDARFSGTVVANLTGKDISNATGTLDVNNLTLQSATEHYELKGLHVESGYAGEEHFITLASDFGEARINGDFNYETLPQSITNFIAYQLPTLPGLPKATAPTANNFSLHATISKSDWLQQLLRVPLRLTQPLTLDGMVNDSDRQLNIECSIPQFYYNESRYDNGHLSIASPQGKMVYDVSVTKLMGNGKQLELQATGSAADNQLQTTLFWDDHAAEHMCGKVIANARFDTNIDGKQVAHIDISPSQMTVNNAPWDIQPSTITYYDKHLDVKHFSIQHGEQFLTLDGTASENSHDSLDIRMHDIDVQYVLDLVNFHAVDFGGLATGGGCLRGVFGNFEADGALTVRQFEFEHGRMGTLHAQVNWNKEQEQIDIHATADDGEDAQTLINGYVSPARNYIDLGIDAEGTHLDFARSFMDSFMSQLTGHANGRLRLAGPLDALNITGELVVNGLADISVLGCSYELRNDTIKLVPNEIIFPHFPIYDINGTEAILSGAIHHQELTNLTFDINVRANNLQAYHFTNFGTDTFYGTVFATGSVDIIGRENGVTIDADITPQRGTFFVYNAAAPDIVSNQEFIQWGSGSNKKEENQDVTNPSAVSSFLYRDDLTMRLKLNATPQAEIRLLMDATTNDYIRLRGNGMLQANYYNKGGFNMFGTYRIVSGTYGLTIQNVIHKNFTFNEGGTVVFGGDPYDATLNLQARHVVNGVSLSDLNVGRSFANTVRVNCLMNITGQPRQPVIDFDLEMPNVNADEQQMVRSIINSEEEMNQQVIYLLAVGRFYPQSSNNAETNERTPSKTSLAMQSLLSGTLSGQINGLLSQVVKSNKWNFGANISTGDEGWNNAEYEGIINGRLLNNRLLINGQFGYRDNATTTNPSFIGDFDIRYLLLPNGNLALKVYNQTNDRYFTRSSLNTQGIGIILKKDFDGIGDLFGKKKRAKKKK